MTQVGHMVLALAVLAGACVLAAIGVIPGSDAFTIIVGVAVGGGVLAGANMTSTPAPLPAPAPPPVAVPTALPPAA